jgi:hypothetical protein
VEELHSRLISAELKGNMSHSFFEPDAPEDNRSWNLASGVLCQPDNYFDRGCKSLAYFSASLDSIAQSMFRVFDLNSAMASIALLATSSRMRRSNWMWMGPF